MSLHRLLPLFDRARASDRPLVLATVIRTAGSTYAKPGAQMLIADDGEYAGLLSGGCLEGDLREHAREVATGGVARIVSYDMRSSHDPLFGLGAGCEGAMDVLLTRVSAQDQWQPLDVMAESARRGVPCRVAFVTSSQEPASPLGLTVTARGSVNGSTDLALASLHEAAASAAPNTLIRIAGRPLELFVAALAPPPHILLLGGGPDARPVAALADFLGWRVTVVDHRPANLDAARFPAHTRLVEAAAAEVAGHLDLDEYAAAIVMSHHLDSDLQYLRAVASSQVPYVGLLGPAARRERLLGDLGELGDLAPALRARLRAPVGLDIGGRTPESIALAIIGEIHAALTGRAGRPFSETAGDGR